MNLSPNLVHTKPGIFMAVTKQDVTNNTCLHHSHPPSIGTYSILTSMFGLYWQLKKQQRILAQTLPGLLEHVVPGYDQSFSSTHLKRTTKYWQLGLQVICDNVYKLTGHTLQADEHKRIMLVSVIGPLFDDLFDDQLLDHVQIESLILNPEKYVPVHQADLLVTKIYLELLRLTPHRQLLLQHLQELYRWQKASLKQLDDSITEEALYQITYNKSYYAVLLYCAVLDHYPTEEILKLFYPVAGLIQLTNDAFDVWKDIQSGVYTLPNLYRNFEQLQQLFLAETAHINHLLWQLPYTAKAKKTFAITIHSLPAMGWMALEQLQKATTGISTFSELSALSRQVLVCDLDSIQQQIQWVRLIRRFANYNGVARPLIN